MNSEDRSRVKKHFHKKADEFDKIYVVERDRISEMIDNLFRKSVYARFELTLQECGDVKGKSVIDVGCGPGRYSVELAKRGANVTGIDFADRMIEKAQRFAESEGVAEKCHFKACDFLEVSFDSTFDICIAMGLFDYISRPLGTLKKMRDVTKEKVIASFPARFSLLTPFRKMRLALKDCPVYFYQKSDVEDLLVAAGFKSFSIRRLYRDYFVVAHPE